MHKIKNKNQERIFMIPMQKNKIEKLKEDIFEGYHQGDNVLKSKVQELKVNLDVYLFSNAQLIKLGRK